MKDIDYDSEDNVENYGKRSSFTSFVVPEDANVTIVEVDWEDATTYATEEMTDDDMRVLGLTDDQ